MSNAVTAAALVESVRAMMNPDRRWVLFEHGTVVVVADDTVEAPTEFAKLKLANDGRMASGTAAGDHAVSTVGDAGWMVGSHDPDIFTFVPATDVEPGSSMVAIGLAGRAARGADIDGQSVLVAGP